jgi:aryl-alcohol dehydrogenase-like predicted oxidoreductase
MLKKEIGKSGIIGSVFHLGAFSFAYDTSAPEYKEAVATVRHAMELGINVFDTAEGYAGGDSERLLADALEGSREKVIVKSKISIENLRAADVRKSCEGS